MNITIKKFLSDLLTEIVKNIALSRNITIDETFSARVDYPPSVQMGHYATPAAMECAKIFRTNPKEIATGIVEKIKSSSNNIFFKEIRIENPGFINFFLSPAIYKSFINDTFIESKKIYELISPQKPENKIIFEFVSANPTGPLNIVSARAATTGDAICKILKVCGYDVQREYYVNDYGNQVRLLGLSFAYRYLEQLGHEISLPEDCYQGDYIKDILMEILNGYDLPENFSNLKNISSDQVASEAENIADFFGEIAVEKLRYSHEVDLKKFGVEFDKFFSEKTLHESKQVENVLALLKKSGYVYQKDGAEFFESTKFADEKDRVIVRSDGRPTYLLADIAYHESKIERGFNRIYDIWGPDHHGYIARLKGAMEALGFGKKPGEEFKVLIVQQVNMIEDGKPVVMSKRLGKFHTMKDLLEKIPADVVRYFFLLRGQSSHLDFDLDLATNHSSKNPVYYIQYAHARICSIFREAGKDIELPVKTDLLSDEILDLAFRSELLTNLWRFPEVLETISQSFEVQVLPEYLYNTAGLFTRFYHEKENNVLAAIRANSTEADVLLKICQLTRIVLKNGLNVLGISAPDNM
jgi:arginyl-tRNA synthetase